MKKIVNLALFATLFYAVVLNASTMYTLSDVKKVYPLVEVRSKHVSKEYKQTILNSLKETLEELGVEYKGYDERALVLVVEEIALAEETILNVRLMIGEQVRRRGSNKDVFAITYQDMDKFLYKKESDIEDKLEDSLALLLDKFSEQYKEEEKKLNALKLDESDFAKTMGYEISYAEALKRARVEQKPMMLVLVANFCPWCRKFENRVLVKKEVDAIVQADYIPVILNKEKDAFPKKFDMSFTPIIHFIDYKNQESYEHVVGYNNKDEFTRLLKKYHDKKREK